MQPKVSVIVPVYKTEKYIERCARSLFEQTMDEIEFIFVNDCTPDNSINILNNILEEYPQRAAQTSIINNEHNLGLAKNRIKGILAAKGEYIINCDSDDWVEKDAYRQLYEYAKSGDFDYVWCDYYRSDGKTSIHVKQECPTDSHTITSNLLTGISTSFIGTVWNRMFKRGLIEEHGIRCPEHSMHEDLVLSIQLTIHSKTIGYYPKPLYYYFYNPQSICVSADINSVPNRLDGSMANNELILKVLSENMDTVSLKRQIECKKFTCKEELLPVLEKSKKYRTMWKEIYPEVNDRITSNPYIPLRFKIQATLLLHNCYPLYTILRKIHTFIKRP